jgi:hypothetical protein|tara:strand:- start:1142 stop:1858 length:717 start_codon:yes stop_codon:yes gene_type:complete
MKYAVCTSFSPSGYESYGKRFIETFKKYWDEEILLYVYYEGEPPSEIDNEQIFGVNLLEDEELSKFLREYDYPAARGITAQGKNYRWQANKFARKVFAITDPNRPPVDYWIWVDADVETFEDIDEEYLAEVCPADCVGSYLGRISWHHSECGFVGYNLNEYADDFLQRFREVYALGEVWSHLEWHDSYIFDRVMEEFPQMKWHDLSEEQTGMDIWAESILSERMVHHKGPLAKQEAYT